jgi:hypothetical protein
MNRATTAVLVLALSGCMPVVTSPVQDIPAVSSSASEIWRTQFNVRSYLADGETEVVGAECRVTGPGFAGSVTTPARIRFPVFRAGRVTTTLTCTSGGQTVTVQKVCRYGSSEPFSSINPFDAYSIDVSTCNQSNVPVIFPRG